MVDPLLALGVALLLTALAIAVFLPRTGLFWRWRKLHMLTERVLIEDSLKHFWDAEYWQKPTTIQSLAGALGISGNRSVEVLVQMEARGLTERTGDEVRLTDPGRTYALRIIRMHRLWERYLAEKTGVSRDAWHDEAETREHTISAGEADAIAAEMGHPRYDLDGDPIPTSTGDLPPRQGMPLASLPAGKVGSIVHVEDEPDAVYAQIVAEGLHPGMRVSVTDLSPERVRFWADGDEYVLAPVVAANLSVVPLPKEEEMEGPFDSLASLKRGERARVLRISGNCRGPERRRLMDLGIVSGTVMEAEMQGLWGDPTAYRVRSTLIALRKRQASQVLVEREAEVA